MSSEHDTERISRNGGVSPSVTPSTALLNRRLGISPAPRMLTRYESDLLRRSKQEIIQVVGEFLASKDSTSGT